jgi:hypothetical protein
MLTVRFSHFVLHDWPDAECKKILDNQKPSMKKGYSKLLIHEVVLDPLAPEASRTTSDITMMGMVSGMESKLPISSHPIVNLTHS